MNKKRSLIAGGLVLAALFFSAGGFERARATAPARAEGWYGTPTPTPTRTVTPTPTPSGVQFRLTNSTAVPPADVLANLAFFQGGGCYDCGNCKADLQPVQPARVLMSPFTQYICWPAPGEWVKLTIYRPDGSRETKYLHARTGDVALTYQPLFNYPTGTYRFRLEGKTVTREYSVDYYAPYAPRLMAVPGSPFLPVYGFQTASSQLVLDHFVPGEKVRLFSFRYSVREADLALLGWQEIVIRGDGRMPVSVDLPVLTGDDTALFAAYGERSGEVHFLQVIGDNYLADPIHDRVLFCPGAKASRLSPNPLRKENLVARVAHTDGTRLRIHQGAGFSSPTIALVPEGSSITLVGGPRCADRSWFWEIEWEKTHGWVAEADQKDYLVEPLYPMLILQPIAR